MVARMHGRLREALKRDFPLVAMFQFPTVRLLAAHLSGAPSETASGDVRARAQQQRQAFARLRSAAAKR